MTQPIHRGPSPLRDALRSVLRDSGLTAGGKNERVFEAWRQAAGPGLHGRAVPVRFRRGELTVEVDSSAHLHELRSFTGDTIRQHANGALGGEVLRKVTFKLKG